MSAQRNWFYKVCLGVAVSCMVVISSVMIQGQPASSHGVAMIEDWSTHHVIFSHPGTAADALARGRFEQWYKIVNDPRYVMQQMKRDPALQGLASSPDFATLAGRLGGSMARREANSISAPRAGKETLKRDWSMALGGAASVTGTVATNSATGTSTITVDGQVLTASAPVAEKATLSFSTYAANGSTITIGSITYTFSTSAVAAAPSSGCTVYSATSNTKVATDLQDAIALTPAGSNTTYRCATGVTANSAVTSTRATHTLTLTAKVAGSTGFAESMTGTTNGTFSSTPGTNGTQSGTNWTYWSGSAADTPVQMAASIAATINANTVLQKVVSATAVGEYVIVNAIAATGGNYTVSASCSGFSWSAGSLGGNETATMGADVFPATYSYSATAGNCDSSTTPDYAVFNTGVAGSANQPSLIAYDNLYSGCTTGAVPLIYWEYNTGGTVSTSVVLSYDGSQAAFVQTEGAAAYLVLLKWSKDTTVATSESAGNYRACTAPCMTTIEFNGDANDTGSAPFYDYANDVIYVGDNSGNLHKFTNIFISGTPAEITGGGTTSGWPQSMGTNALSSPVYDPVTQNVYVGSVSAASGGSFSLIPAAGGSEYIVTGLTETVGTGFGDAALIDPVAGMVYAFVNDNAGGNAAVYQLPTNFTASTTPNVETLGEGATTGIVYTGSFDNIYYTNSAPTGNLYVCGRAATTQTPTMWQVPITNNVLEAAVAGPAVASTTTTCSPLTEFYNGTTDLMFLSVQSGGLTGLGCTTAGSGCIMSFNVTSASTWGTGITTNSAATEAGGTSGMVIDNAFTTPSGTSNVYFSPLSNQPCAGNSAGAGVGTGACAIQALQTAL
jgi:hypothetical protein